MSQRRKILFATDFAETSDVSFGTAQFLARKFDADLVIIHAIEAPKGVAKMVSGFDEAKARKMTKKMIQDYIKKNGDPAITYEPIIKIGKPYKAIVEAAAEISAYLIVMGTHGLSGFQEYFAGTNASKVIRTAPCPVMSLMQKPAEIGFKKILLPLDLTKETGEKITWGLEFAQKFDCELLVLTVSLDNDEVHKKKLTKRMNKAVKWLQAHGAKVDSKLLEAKGNIADIVMDYAATAGADLVFIMAQQDLDLREQAFGSYAAHIVNNSKIPVLSIKPMKQYHERQFESATFG